MNNVEHEQLEEMTNVEREQLEEMLERLRPERGTENDPVGQGQLFHLNYYGLLEDAIDLQWERDGGDDDAPATVITKQVAFEILADAQREGLKMQPISALRRAIAGKPFRGKGHRGGQRERARRERRAQHQQ